MDVTANLRRIGALIALVVLLVLILLTLSWCGERRRAAEARGERDMAQGRTVSAVEAIDKIGDLQERGDATDAQVEEAHNAIRQADPADRDRVARHRLCVLQQRPDCDGMLRAGAGGADD